MQTETFSMAKQESTAILDELFDGVYMIDRDRRIVFWNHGAEIITGYSKQEMIGRKCDQSPLKHTDEAGCDLCQKHCPAMTVMEKNEPEIAVVWVHRANGDTVPVETHIRPLKNDSGEIIGAIEVFRNVSHWKRLEELLKEKDRFMGILAHDIRNPLAVVQSYAHFLEHEDDPDIKEIGEILKRRVRYALTLVNDMLDAQTIDSGSIIVNLEEVDVTACVHQAITNFTEEAKAKDIEIELDVIDQCLKLIIDPIRLEDILNNLISNAIHYSHIDSRLDISIQQVEEEVAITVQDYGVGIRPEDQSKFPRI